jgi:hypothetical protein
MRKMTDLQQAIFDHTGSGFDSFLEEEGVREQVEAAAVKRVTEWLEKNCAKALPPTKSVCPVLGLGV